MMTDRFNGDNAKLVSAIEALLELDASGSLVPHGVGGHARTMLEAAAVRLSASKPAAPMIGFTVDCSQRIDDVLPADRRWTIAKAIGLVAEYRNCASGETKEVMQRFADYMRAALAASPAAPSVASAAQPVEQKSTYRLSTGNEPDSVSGYDIGLGRP
jgi:hypothetical protein